MSRVPTRSDAPPDFIPVYRTPTPTEEQAAERKKFYKRAAWQRCRALKLAEAHGLCERCKARGVIEPATQVHHIIDVVVAPELAYVLANLEALCQGCHSRETMGRNQERWRSEGGSRNPRS